MNKVIIVSLALCLFCACKEMAPTHASIVMASQNIKEMPKDTVDTLTIDARTSEIWWNGTKMFGVKSHSGIIQLKSGFIEVKDEKLLGGSFFVNMNTIEVTDIPAHDPIPKRRLENHLKDPDFFDVKRHPEAHLRITSVKPITEENLEFTGQLTIRGITNDVIFTGEFSNNHLKATLHFDRFRWNVAYQGSWVNRSLIDRKVELKVDIRVLDMSNNNGS